MIDWNQSGSKEKLMLYLLRSSEAIRDRCPGAESLIAFSEKILDGEKYELIQAHLDICPACSEIDQRLSRFEDANALLPESEWQNAEKRLGNWMESFLKEESASQTHPARLWARFLEWMRIRKIRYALAATTALVLLAGASLYQLYRTPASPSIASVSQEQKISPPKAGQPSPPTAEMESSRPKEIESAVAAFQGQKSSHPEAAKQDLPTIEMDSSRLKEIPGLTPASASGFKVPELTTMLKSSPIPLFTMQVEVGTAMLMRVDFVLKKNPAENAVFRGVLVQPLVQGGKEVFPANSIVVGDGRVSGREVILRIAEISAPFAQPPPQHEVKTIRYVLVPSEVQPNVSGQIPESHDDLSPGVTIELQFVTSSSYLREEDRPR
jgi:hypothetical protein